MSVCRSLFFTDTMSGRGRGANGFEGREEEEVPVQKYNYASGPATKQEAVQQQHRVCDVAFSSRCRDATDV